MKKRISLILAAVALGTASLAQAASLAAPPQATQSEASLRQGNSVLRMAARPPGFSSDSTRHRTLRLMAQSASIQKESPFTPNGVKKPLHIIAETRNDPRILYETVW